MLIVILCAHANAAGAQTASAEVDVTGGYSFEEIKGAAVQTRVFGDTGKKSGVQFFAEAAWGQRWAGDDPFVGTAVIGMDPMGTDVFGAAYPYNKKIDLIEAYGERFFHPRGFVLGARGGQFRTPFGIYNRSDYGYSGFIRPPLIRYDGYFALSNNYLERGAMFTAGVPALFLEMSVGRPHDIGSSHRRPGVDGSIRVQGYFRSIIIGASHVRSNPYMPAFFAHGRQVFNGIDARWAHHTGVQLRGEFVRGRSYDGVLTNGFYVDGALHHIGMGPFTGVARIEATDYQARPPFARSAHRFTIGARLRLPAYVTAQVNYMHQHGDLPRIYDNSVDFTVTYSIRYH